MAPRGASSPEGPLIPLQERGKPNTALIRQQVLGRDRHRCAVPGCRNRGDLYAHHVRWKSHGGRTEIINEISLCWRCHGLVHDDPNNPHPDADDPTYWYFINLEDPNDLGYQAVRQVFWQAIAGDLGIE